MLYKIDLVSDNRIAVNSGHTLPFSGFRGKEKLIEIDLFFVFPPACLHYCWILPYGYVILFLAETTFFLLITGEDQLLTAILIVTNRTLPSAYCGSPL